jgi:O-methyltransferase involved in polyketide biosynthesis
MSKGDLSVTALYTAGTWAWAGMPGAELLADDDARRVFAVTNAALKLRPSAPSLRHALVQRHVMIDRVVEDARPRHVLELAAGLSRRGAHLSGNPDITVTEIDLAAVIARKKLLLQRTPEGQAVLARDNFRLIEGDVATIDLLALDLQHPLAVVAEGLLMYLDGPAQRALFARIRPLLDHQSVFVFDLVPQVEQPAPGVAGRALGALMRRFTRGADFQRDTRTRDDVLVDLAAAGFTTTVLEPKDAPGAWQVPHLDQRTQQLVWIARPA